MKIIVLKHPESNDVDIVLAKVVYSCDLLISYEQDGHKNHISLCYMKLLNINDGPQNINEYKKYPEVMSYDLEDEDPSYFAAASF